MDILRLAALAVITALCAVFLKQYKREYAILVSMAGGALLVTTALPYMREILAAATSLSQKAGLAPAYMGAILKVIAVSFITECAGALCRDAGESALAAKLEMAGKLVILALAMPVVRALFETVLSILP